MKLSDYLKQLLEDLKELCCCCAKDDEPAPVYVYIDEKGVPHRILFDIHDGQIGHIHKLSKPKSE